MSRHLFTVEDTFLIRGRGLVLVPGIIPRGEERFRAGDPIALVMPDGSSARVNIGSLELLNPNTRGGVPIVLKEASKKDVPVGTEVWSVDT